MSASERSTREKLWDPAVKDVFVLFLGLRWVGEMEVIVSTPQKIVVVERMKNSVIPIHRYYPNNYEFATHYQPLVDENLIVYASEM